MKTSVSGILGLDTTASGADDVELGKKLNDAVRDFLVRTHAKVSTATMTLTAGTGDYTLPVETLAIQDFAGASTTRLERTSPAEILDRRRASSSTGTGAVNYLYALNGADLLMLYPTPGSADVLTIYYVPKPTEMTGSNDPSNATYGGIPVEYHPALEEYAKWKMADYDDDSSSSMGMSYQAEYMRLVRDAKRNIRQRGGRTLGRVNVGRRPFVPSNRSQDI
jgi:hypothetical protein